MNRNNKRPGLILVFIILSMIPFKLSAQEGMAAMMPVDGFVVLSNGDTIQGKIRWSLKYVENNPVEIKFFAGDGTSKTYNASEIQGFGNYLKLVKKDFNTPEELEPEYYVSMPSLKKAIPVFMNRLLDGRITVFQNRSSLGFSGSRVEELSKFDGISFSFGNNGLSIGPVYRTSYRIIAGRNRYSSYYVSKNKETLIKVDKNNYESLFPSLFGDCPAINKETEKNPDLRKFKNFTILAEVYNEICSILPETH